MRRLPSAQGMLGRRRIIGEQLGEKPASPSFLAPVELFRGSVQIVPGLEDPHADRTGWRQRSDGKWFKPGN